jgi:hypothetical protein
MSVEYFERRLRLADDTNHKLTPMAFEASQYCTYEFAAWWSLHYEKHAKDEKLLLRALNAGFNALQPKTPKSKGNLNNYQCYVHVICDFEFFIDVFPSF